MSTPHASRESQANSPHEPNRLAAETSPYLLQHAHNPVDWFPWGPEAFAEARRRDVPIFLSIGYSTCYWCHVMERESFEDTATGELMSRLFVCIKVDREERPEVDDLYMAATQIMTGSGGWPMSVFLEPATLRPFQCGTYFPPRPMHGRPSFAQVLTAMSDAYRTRRAEVLAQAKAVADAVADHHAAKREPQSLGIDDVATAAQTLLRMLDRQHGGFGSAPKFPQPVFLELLLDVRDAAGDEQTRAAIDAAAKLTLDRMAVGGLFDQTAGGFHRYCVDAHWTVPHFEKMLYDNAQLLALYARAARTYSDAFYATIAQRTFTYLAREMTADGAPKPGGNSYDQPGTPPPSHGMFFSAQDAEVAGREGANVTWTESQARAVLPADLADLAVKLYRLAEPNFRDPHHPSEPMTSVLRLADRPDRLAAELHTSPGDLEDKLAAIHSALYAARSARPAPRLDDKSLTAWNAMTIAALARASAQLANSAMLAHAARVAESLLTHNLTAEGTLLRSTRHTIPGPPAVLEDFAFLIDALLALDAAGQRSLPIRGNESSTLGLAMTLTDEATARFSDGRGHFFDTPPTDTLFIRPRSTHDGAVPSAVGVILHNLITLHERTGDRSWLDRAMDCLAALSPDIAGGPVGVSNSTRALLRMLRLAPKGSDLAERIATLGPRETQADQQGDPRTDDFTPVEVYANVERVALAADQPAVIRLVLRIAPGYHINAADPYATAAPTAPKNLIPLRVGIHNGTGVAVSADYPAGTPFGPDGISVLTGEHEFRILLERSGDWSARPMLIVTFQPCTDTACLAPVTAELDVALDRA